MYSSAAYYALESQNALNFVLTLYRCLETGIWQLSWWFYNTQGFRIFDACVLDKLALTWDNMKFHG